MNKTFDCVEMKRKGAEKVQEKIAGLSLEEKIKYWQERSAVFKKEIEAAKAKKAKTPIS
jgi:hypothetical protein